MEKFDSPQEEAFEIAYNTRKKILNREEDILSVLRSCSVVANNLAKKEDSKWIIEELEGIFENIPNHRKISCYCEKGRISVGIKRVGIVLEMGLLAFHLKENKNIHFSFSEGEEEFIAIITPSKIVRLIEGAMNKCLEFLNSCISELQYGEYVGTFFEGIRKKVDKEMENLDKKILPEFQSMYLNLISKNPADKPKVAHSCRRILKFLADKVFPASNKKYKTRDRREWDVKDNNFLNRLICFLDQKATSRLILSECEYLEKYLRALNIEIQKGEHKEELSEHDANLLALHTYLILSEILEKLPPSKKK